VIAEDDVEALVRQRHSLGGPMDQRELDARFRHRVPRMLELTLRVVEADDPCA
jgi:hypothetical protein